MGHGFDGSYGSARITMRNDPYQSFSPFHPWSIPLWLVVADRPRPPDGVVATHHGLLDCRHSSCYDHLRYGIYAGGA